MSDKLYEEIGLPECGIKTNDKQLEIANIKNIPEDVKPQFCRTNNYNTFFAKVKSPINKKWLEAVKKYNMKYYHYYNVYDCVDNNLIMYSFSWHSLYNLEEFLIESKSEKLNTKDIKNIIEITPVEFYDLLKKDAELEEESKGEKNETV